MIETFRSKALAAYWNQADSLKLPPASLDRLRLLLQALSAATAPTDMNLPGFDYRPLKGRQAGRFAVRVTNNWRLTFAWTAPNAVSVGLEDYH